MNSILLDPVSGSFPERDLLLQVTFFLIIRLFPDMRLSMHREAIIDSQNFTLNVDDVHLRQALYTICDAAKAAGGRALLVGGCVRDATLGLPAKDLDIEVYGITPDRLIQLLGERFVIDLVGEAFGVIKVHNFPIDVSIPRKESKAGMGHRGFEIMSDPSMDFEVAAWRRDFTMNAMGYDPLTNKLLDPYRGHALRFTGLLMPAKPGRGKTRLMVPISTPFA